MRVAKVAALLLLSACGGSLPAKVANRPLQAGTDPKGTWVLEGGTATMAFSAPSDKGQLWDVAVGQSAADRGKALSDGDWVYVMRPAMSGSKVGLIVYERTAEGLEGIWGIYKLGLERAIGRSDKGFAATYSVEGVNPLSKSYKSELKIAAAAAPETYELSWDASGTMSGGIGLEANGKLVGLRWPLGTHTNKTAGITEDFGRPHAMLVAAYRISGDRMEGRALDSDAGKLSTETWTRRH